LVAIHTGKRPPAFAFSEDTMIEMIDRSGQVLGKTTRWTLIQDLSRYHVKALTCVQATAIESGRDKGRNAEGQAVKRPVVTVILGIGSRLARCVARSSTLKSPTRSPEMPIN
jgi:hypothetical protein